MSIDWQKWVRENVSGLERRFEGIAKIKKIPAVSRVQHTVFTV